jgi:serine/threonine-protein kinase
MFEILAGRLPFVASTQPALAMMHLRDEPPNLSMFNPGVPQALEIIVHKVLAKEPSARYRTADQLGRILISYREQGEGITGTQASAAPPPRVASPTEIPAAHRPQRTRFEAEEPATVPGDLPADEPLRGDAYSAEEEEPGFDWVALALGFVAFVAVAGLIPLWIWVIQVYTR